MKVLEARVHEIFILEAAGGGVVRPLVRNALGIDSLVPADLQRRLGDANHTHADGP